MSTYTATSLRRSPWRYCFHLYLQDGLHAAGFLKHQRARHRLLYESGVLGVDEEENWLFSITDVVFGYHRKLHVGGSMQLSGLLRT